MRTKGRIAVLLIALSGSACSIRPQVDTSGGIPSPDLTVITRGQLLQNHFHDVYDAVASMRANWLQLRGPDSFVRPSQILVYLDDIRVGGIETLHSIPIGSVQYLRHIDGLEATSRWGVDHGAGVIFVSTRVAGTHGSE